MSLQLSHNVLRDILVTSVMSGWSLGDYSENQGFTKTKVTAAVQQSSQLFGKKIKIVIFQTIQANYNVQE